MDLKDRNIEIEMESNIYVTNKYSNLNFREKKLLSKSLIKDFYLDNNPGISFAVISDGEIIVKGCHGLSDYDKKKHIDLNTRFYLASVSKQFTAMAILQLVEKYGVNIDDNINKYFPELSHLSTKIKVRHLLNHTSGLPNYFKIVSDAIGITNSDVLNILINSNETYFECGEKFEYNNSNYILLAILVERVTNLPFHEYLEKYIFEPLNMKNTYVYYDKNQPSDNNRAIGYIQDKQGISLLDYDRKTAGGGGIYSCINDLFKWDQALYTERLVKKSTLESAFTSGIINNNIKTGYGFGWRIGSVRGLDYVYHTGSSRGFRSMIKRFPNENFSVIMLCNSNKIQHSLANKISEIFLDIKMVQNCTTHLHLAVERNDQRVAKYLIDKSIYLYAKDGNSKTPLDLAVENRNFNIVKAMIEKMLIDNNQSLKEHDKSLKNLALNFKQESQIKEADEIFRLLDKIILL